MAISVGNLLRGALIGLPKRYFEDMGEKGRIGGVARETLIKKLQEEIEKSSKEGGEGKPNKA